MNEIIINGDIHSDKELHEGNVCLIESLTGDELQYDTLDVTLEGEETTEFILADDRKLECSDSLEFKSKGLEGWEYSNPLYYYHKDILIGKFYIENISRVGKKKYNITAMSGIGLLSNSQHYGGIYFGKKMKDLVSEIIGNEVKYSIDPLLANQPIYGWLPIATRRENLHQVLFAMNSSVKKDNKGDIFITSLSNEVSTNISDRRIFVGGSIEYPQACTKVSLSEHAYIERSDDESVTLYDGEISADKITSPSGVVMAGGLILFDTPAHDLTATGTRILESGVNYAVLAPSAECQLVGLKYTHTVRQVTRPETPQEGDESTENKVTVSEATLVSVANSENIAEKLSNYYASAKTIKMDIVVEEERPGNVVDFNDPFDEPVQGILSSMDISMSNVLRASTEIISGYEPPNAGNYYENVLVLTETSEWLIPEGTEKVRLVLIGGGQAGFTGETGESGEASTGTSYKNGGAGGLGGNGGNGGKILIFTLDTAELSKLSIACGNGGADGNGGLGTESTVKAYQNGNLKGIYSSDEGTVSSIGYVELFNGISYGVKGADGIAGAAGTDPKNEKTTLTFQDKIYKSGEKGEDGSMSWSKNGQKGTINYKGGYGGGAAVAVDGNASVSQEGSKSVSCYGGDGASATVDGENAQVYGCGGDGGHGGGGGGAGGYAAERWKDDSGSWSWNDEMKGGAGGIGSKGGNGADGCVIIYY